MPSKMNPQNNWYYKYVDLNTNPDGFQEIIDFVNEKSPSGIEGIQRMLLGGNEFNIWVREDHSDCKYKIEIMPYDGDGKVLTGLSEYFKTHDASIAGVGNGKLRYPIILITKNF